MLNARKIRQFEKLFAVYNRNLIRRKFRSLNVSGLENLRGKTPVILYANHSSWWDGLLAFEISRAADLDTYFMMEERQLRKLFVFSYLGAFSVVRENARAALKSVNYAAELLRQNRNRAVWIFPQGEILPNDVRPIKFYSGVSRIIEKTGNCYAVPIAFRYEFLGEFKPQVFVKIGEPEVFTADKTHDVKILTKHLSAKLTAALDDLKTEILSRRVDDYEKIV